MQYYAIRYIIAHVTVKHVSEDDIMFTFGSAVKGLTDKSKTNCRKLSYKVGKKHLRLNSPKHFSMEKF